MKKEVFIMDNPFLKLTVTDRQILNSYALMLNGLGAYLGDGYELVLHSLESLDIALIVSAEITAVFRWKI
jgi:predicted transcriptional regulator YheO